MEGGRAKVGDFGIAHVPRDAGGTYLGALTATGFQPGTLIYMSPEQIRGQPVDGRSDVYQVGALVYEMLTGRHYVDMGVLERRARETAGSNVLSFQRRMSELLEKEICERNPEWVCWVRPDVPEWAGEAVMSALTKRVEERPAASVLAQALRSEETVQVVLAMPRSTVDVKLAEEHFNRGVAYKEQWRLDEAIREFQAALRINPNLVEAHRNLGTAYLHKLRVDDAIHEYQAALHINPDHAETHFNLGEVYWRKGKGSLDKAIREYQAALRTNPGYVQAHLSLGKAYGQQGRLDEAMREYQAVLRIDPDNAEAHIGLGITYGSGQQARLDEAIREFQIALRVDPSCYSTFQGQMFGYLLSEDHWGDYIRLHQAWVRVDPNNPEAHCELGSAYKDEGRLDEAIRELQTALRINPYYADAHLELGAAYAQQGRRDKAMREIKAGEQCRQAEDHCHMAYVHWQQSRWNEAIREFQTALRFNPNDARAHVGLGTVYGTQGRWDEAIREAELALQLGFEPARELLAMLMQDMQKST